MINDLTAERCSLCGIDAEPEDICFECGRCTYCVVEHGHERTQRCSKEMVD